MSESSGEKTTILVTADPDARIWMVEVDGNVYGPYSLNQISRYLTENRVRPQSTLSSSQWPDQKWTVSELLEQLRASNEAPGEAVAPVTPMTSDEPSSDSARPSTPAPQQLPERTNEITMTLSRPVLTEARPEDDPATGLFEVLQTVRENKPAPRVPSSAPEVAGVSKSAGALKQASKVGWKQPHRLALLGVIALVVVGSMAMMVRWLKFAGNKMETVAQQEKTAPTGNKPASLAPVQRLPSAPAAPVTAAQPKTTFKPAPRLVLPPPTQSAPAPAAQTQNAPSQRDERDNRDPRDYDPRGNNASRGARDFRDPRDQQDLRDPRDFRDPRDDRDPRDPRDPRDFRDPRDPRDPRYARDPRDSRDLRNPGEYREEAPAGVDPNVPDNPFNSPQYSQDEQGQFDGNAQQQH